MTSIKSLSSDVKRINANQNRDVKNIDLDKSRIKSSLNNIHSLNTEHKNDLKDINNDKTEITHLDVAQKDIVSRQKAFSSEITNNQKALESHEGAITKLEVK